MAGNAGLLCLPSRHQLGSPTARQVGRCAEPNCTSTAAISAVQPTARVCRDAAQRPIACVVRRSPAPPRPHCGPSPPHWSHARPRAAACVRPRADSRVMSNVVAYATATPVRRRSPFAVLSIVPLGIVLCTAVQRTSLKPHVGTYGTYAVRYHGVDVNIIIIP